MKLTLTLLAFLKDQHIVYKDVHFGHFECFSTNNSEPIASWATTLIENQMIQVIQFITTL